MHFFLSRAAGPAPPVGGPRRGAPRLRSACHFSFHRAPLGRHHRWAARDEVRPGCVPHVTSHSTELRWAGAFGGWPETRCAPAPYRMSLLIPPSSAGPAPSVGSPRRGAPRLRSACHFSFQRKASCSAPELEDAAPHSPGVDRESSDCRRELEAAGAGAFPGGKKDTLAPPPPRPMAVDGGDRPRP